MKYDLQVGDKVITSEFDRDEFPYFLPEMKTVTNQVGIVIRIEEYIDRPSTVMVLHHENSKYNWPISNCKRVIESIRDVRIGDKVVTRRFSLVEYPTADLIDHIERYIDQEGIITEITREPDLIQLHVHGYRWPAPVCTLPKQESPSKVQLKSRWQLIAEEL